MYRSEHFITDQLRFTYVNASAAYLLRSTPRWWLLVIAFVIYAVSSSNDLQVVVKL